MTANPEMAPRNSAAGVALAIWGAEGGGGSSGGRAAAAFPALSGLKTRRAEA
ncbi:MAG: hypothetical protein LAQ30_20430 [Acidobacteriia bacterium]|nr:hypothetical protein [Terriglobia bacterium]